MKTFVIRSVRAALMVALAGGLVPSANAQQSAPPPPMRDTMPSIRAPLGETGNNTAQMQNAFVPNRDTVGSMKAYGEVLRVARCIAARGRNQVVKALESVPSSAVESRLYSRTYETFDSCGPQHTAILSLQRGSWSETMYLKQHPEAPAANVDAGAASAFVEREKSWNAEREAGDQNVIAATNCLVANRTVEADRVLRTEHGSDEEAALLDQIFANAPQCAGPVRPQSLSRTFLRAFLADSLYRAAEGSNKLAVFAE